MRQELFDLYNAKNWIDMYNYIFSKDKQHTEECLLEIFKDYICETERCHGFTDMVNKVIDDIDFITDTTMINVFFNAEGGVYLQQQLMIKRLLNKTLMVASDNPINWVWYEKLRDGSKSFTKPTLNEMLDQYKDVGIVRNEASVKIFELPTLAYQYLGYRETNKVIPLSKGYTINREFNGTVFYWGINNQWTLIDDEICYYYNKITANYHLNILKEAINEYIYVNEALWIY